MSTGAHVRVPMRAQGTGQARQGRPFNVRYLDSKRRWLLWQRRLWYTPLHEAASKIRHGEDAKRGSTTEKLLARTREPACHETVFSLRSGRRSRYRGAKGRSSVLGERRRAHRGNRQQRQRRCSVGRGSAPVGRRPRTVSLGWMKLRSCGGPGGRMGSVSSRNSRLGQESTWSTRANHPVSPIWVEHPQRPPEKPFMCSQVRRAQDVKLCLRIGVRRAALERPAPQETAP
eukprot:1181969-Prorocentrum_minimum.AAC.3